MINFSQALKNKYVDQQDIDDKFIIPKDNVISTQITLIGFGKVSSIQKQLRRLTSIDLSRTSISFAGELSELSNNLERVRILNLSDNKLTNWLHVVEILKLFPNLRELILSNNPIELLKNSQFTQNGSKLKSLESLVLGQINLDWSNLIDLVSSTWISVEHLDLWNNNLTDNSFDYSFNNIQKNIISRLTCLKLRENHILRFASLENIGSNLILLKELDLSKCHLKEISISSYFAASLINLRYLNISYNDLETWKDLSQLSKLTNLQNLICHENPFFILEKHAKAFTLGRLEKLKVLNREEISQSFRTDSEILYLRRFFPQFKLFDQGRDPEFLKLHPRYLKLIELYGLPVGLDTAANTKKYVNIVFCHADNKVGKKLPCDMRVANAKMLSKRLLNLPPSSLVTITCVPHGCREDLKYVLDKDGQTLQFFSVDDGYVLNVEEN